MRKHIAKCLALLVVATVVCYMARASADELVRFESAPFRLGLIQQRLARERGESPKGASEIIEGYLSKPEGSGPFPAIVYLHGCNGLSENARKRVAELMTGWGYVLLAVDSFASRGIKQACDQPMPPRQGDALGALSYLSNVPYVDPHRVAVVGSSQGGIIALELASTRQVGIFDVPEERKFKAAVAYYPLCSVAADELSIPTLVMIGELDDWTPAGYCNMWMKRRSGRGAPVKLIVYPGAYHAFDVPAFADGRTAFGHWLKYDADAAERSILEMQHFLAAQLAN